VSCSFAVSVPSPPSSPPGLRRTGAMVAKKAAADLPCSSPSVPRASFPPPRQEWSREDRCGETLSHVVECMTAWADGSKRWLPTTSLYTTQASVLIALRPSMSRCPWIVQGHYSALRAEHGPGLVCVHDGPLQPSRRRGRAVICDHCIGIPPS